MSSGSAQAVRNALPLYAAEFCSRLLVFVLFVISARILEPDGYGHLIFASSVLTLAAFAGDFGSGTLITKRVAADHALAPRHVMTGILGRLGPLLLAHAVAVAYVWWTGAPRAVMAFVLVGAAATLATVHIGPVSGALRALNRMGADAWIRSINVAVYVGVSIVALRLGLGLAGLAIGTAAGVLAGGIVAAGFGFRSGLLSAAPPLSIREFLRLSAPFGLQALLSIMYLRMPAILLEEFAGSRQVGLYGAAYRLVEPFYALPQIFAAAMFPIIVRSAAAGDLAAVRTLAQKSMRLFLALAIPASVTLAVAATDIVSLLYGRADYADAAPVLRIVAWAMLATFVSAFPSMLLQSSSRPSSITWICGGMLIINLGVNLALIPHYGAIGAAVACVATEAAGVLLALPIASRLLVRLALRDIVLRPLAAAALAAPCLLLGPRFGLGLFLAVYGVAVYFLDRDGAVADVRRALREIS